MAVDSAGETVEESGPATAGVELGGGFVEWGPTSSAVVHSLLREFVVLAGARVSM